MPPFGRFWAKLHDVNTIDFEYLIEDQPWWFGVADRLRAGGTIELRHDLQTVPACVTVAPLAARTSADIAGCGARWLVYAEGARIGFWLVDDTPERWTSLAHVPGKAFGHKDQLRGGALPLDKVIGRVVAIGGAT